MRPSSEFTLHDAPQIFDPELQDDTSVASLESEGSELARKPDIDDDLFNLLTQLRDGTKKKKKNKKAESDDEEGQEASRNNGGGSDEEEQEERQMSREGVRAMKLHRYKDNNNLTAEDSFLKNFLIKAGKMKDDPEFGFEGADDEDYHFDTSKLSLEHPVLSGESERKKKEGTSKRTIKNERRKTRKNDMLAMLKESERVKSERKREKQRKDMSDEESENEQESKGSSSSDDDSSSSENTSSKKSEKISVKKSGKKSESASDNSDSETESDDSSSSESDSDTNKMGKKKKGGDAENTDEENPSEEESDASSLEEKPEEPTEEQMEELMEFQNIDPETMDLIAKREEELSLEILVYIRELQSKFIKGDGSALSKVTATTYEEFDAQVDSNAVVEEIFHPTFDPTTRKKEELDLRRKIYSLMADYHSVYAEYANNSHRFKYRKIERVNFGLSANDLLTCDDEIINQNAPIDIYGRPVTKKSMKKKSFENKQRMKGRRFNNKGGPRAPSGNGFRKNNRGGDDNRTDSRKRPNNSQQGGIRKKRRMNDE